MSEATNIMPGDILQVAGVKDCFIVEGDCRQINALAFLDRL